jgi:hypothetical protein
MAMGDEAPYETPASSTQTAQPWFNLRAEYVWPVGEDPDSWTDRRGERYLLTALECGEGMASVTEMGQLVTNAF